MKTFFQLLTIFLLVESQAHPQEQIEHLASDYVNAVVNHDLVTELQCIYPQFIEMKGGKTKVLKSMRENQLQEQAKGENIQQFVLGKSGPIFKAGGKQYALLPCKVIVSTKAGEYSYLTSLMCIRSDSSKKWYIVESGALVDYEIKKYFPDVYGKLWIPQRTIPVPISK